MLVPYYGAFVGADDDGSLVEPVAIVGVVDGVLHFAAVDELDDISKRLQIKLKLLEISVGEELFAQGCGVI